MTSTEEFEKLVVAAIDEIPPYFLEKMSNIEVLIKPYPTKTDLDSSGVEKGFTLLGLYSGIPLTERTHNYALVPPDTITLYKRNIELAAGDPKNIPAVVRRTVIHEIAHHFGISDDRLRELGAY